MAPRYPAPGMPPTAEAETLPCPGRSVLVGVVAGAGQLVKDDAVFSVSMEQHGRGQGTAEERGDLPDLQFADFPPACRDRDEIGLRRDVDRATTSALSLSVQVGIVDGEHEIGQQPSQDAEDRAWHLLRDARRRT